MILELALKNLYITLPTLIDKVSRFKKWIGNNILGQSECVRIEKINHYGADKEEI